MLRWVARLNLQNKVKTVKIYKKGESLERKKKHHHDNSDDMAVKKNPDIEYKMGDKRG